MERIERRQRWSGIALAASLVFLSSACELGATAAKSTPEGSSGKGGTDVAIEEIVISHEGLDRTPPSTQPATKADTSVRSAIPAPPPSPEAMADLDGDGTVGAKDFFSVMRPCFGADLSARPECVEADLDEDGVVGPKDFFGGFRPNFGKVVDPGPTPETEALSAQLLDGMMKGDRGDHFARSDVQELLLEEVQARSDIGHKLQFDLQQPMQTFDIASFQEFAMDVTLFDARDPLDGIELGLEDLRTQGIGGFAFQRAGRQSGLRTFDPALDTFVLGSGATRSGGTIFDAFHLADGVAAQDHTIVRLFDSGLVVDNSMGGSIDEFEVIGGNGGGSTHSHLPTFPGTIINEGGEYLVRYAAWDGLPVHASPYFNGGQVDTLSRNQLVWVTDASPWMNLKSELEDSLDDSLWYALGSYGAQYYLEVFVVDTGVTGYVPLYSLAAQPLQFAQDHIRAEVGYGLMARHLNDAILDTFEPDGCEEPQVMDISLASVDLWAVSEEGPFRPCTEEEQCTQCYEVLANPDQYLSDKEKCWENPEAYFGDCKDLDTFSWVPYCEDHMIFAGQTYAVPNTDDYRCGEYPVGATNWYDPDWETYDHNEMVNNRRLHEFVISGWEHDVKMKRGQHQTGFTLDKYNLSQSSVVEIAFDGSIDSRNFWMAIEPSHGAYSPQENGNNRSMRIHACGHLPGGRVFSPHKDYGSWDGNANGIDDFFYWIKWGTMDWDRADACAIANISIAGGSVDVVWEEITELRLAGFNLSNFGWSLRTWVILSAGLALVFSFGLFGPVIGGIIATAVSATLSLAIAGTAIVNLTNNDEWVITDVVEFVGKGKVYDMILDELNDMTQQQLNAALANVPTTPAQACAAAFPGGMPPAGSPARMIYNQCIGLANNVQIVPFIPHAGNEQDGCYDLDHFWTPEDKTTPNVGPWWYRFQGQGWVDGTEHQDTGCRVGFAGRTSLEVDMWPVLQCMAAETNLFFNNDLSTGALIGNISANCSGVAHQALSHYFGPASDIHELLEAVHPDDGTPDDFQQN